ncbi:unnamed protein product [Moneuplotes crassus]|uniref:Rhodanese domain-containing protein n=2 Tax=Euplotes crassus TaxID=5936 RepID=A0AAD1XMH7_EUPCR|nr:unnamed protein product [Moneuplotes crassus]
MSDKYAPSGAIDMKAMIQAEKKKRQQADKIIQITRETAFNLLQDMRHLLILDVRPAEEFEKNHLRDSFNFTLEDIETKLPEFLKYCKTSQDRLRDTTDTHRRLIIVTSVADEDVEGIKPLLKEVLAFHKIMKLKNGFADFHEKYPFLCLNSESTEEEVKKAESRYPSEIIPNKLFLGNFINSLNEEHFKNLNITKLIGMTPNEAENMEESKCISKYIHLKMDELVKPDLDFEELQTLVTTTIDDGEGAVLIYCLQGNLSAAVCIHMLMQEKKWGRELAAAAIMNKRPEVKNIPTWLFQQIDAPKIDVMASSALHQLLS